MLLIRAYRCLRRLSHLPRSPSHDGAGGDMKHLKWVELSRAVTAIRVAAFGTLRH